MALKKSQKELLHYLYYNAKSASQFSGVDRLLRSACKIDNSITRNHVVEFLSGQSTYTLHKRAIRRYPRLRTVPSGLHTDWQADLAQLDKFAKENK